MSMIAGRIDRVQDANSFYKQQKINKGGVMDCLDFNIGDLVTVRGTQELGVIVKLGREFPEAATSLYKSQYADIKWSDIQKPCRIYKCYGNWDCVEVASRAKT